MVALKCGIVGDHGTGKLSMLKRFMLTGAPDDEFYLCYTEQMEMVVDGSPYELQTFCISATENEPMRRLYCSQTNIVIICFSIACRNTFENVDAFFSEVRLCTTAPIILVGTQLDLRNSANTKDPVLHYQGMQMAHKIGAALYIECSSKTGEGVKTVFNNAVRVALHPEIFMKKKENKQCLLQ